MWSVWVTAMTNRAVIQGAVVKSIVQMKTCPRRVWADYEHARHDVKDSVHNLSIPSGRPGTVHIEGNAVARIVHSISL